MNTVEDIYQVTDLMDSPVEQSQIRRKRSAAPTSVVPELHLQWPLEGEKFIITLNHTTRSKILFCAKDDIGKTMDLPN